MKTLLLTVAIVAATISAPSFAADQVIWSCKINGAETYIKLVEGEEGERYIVTPFGDRYPSYVFNDGLKQKWRHRDGETRYVIVIEPTFEAGFYDFTDVGQGELTLPEYRMKCKKEADLKASLQSEENQRSSNTQREAYVLAIRQKVERHWRKPPGNGKMPVCEVNVVQGPGGIILDVSIGACGGSTATYQASIENAVYKAEPLPKPGDPALFERELTFLFGPEGSSENERSADEIERVFQQNKGGIFNLYNRALRKNPSLSGQVLVVLTISPDGQVTAAKMLSSELGDETLERKLIAKIKKFKFSNANVREITVTYPIDFLPS